MTLPVHSPLGASSYDRWGKSLGGCPGSIRQCKGISSVSSVYAEEGTEAHTLAYAMLMGQPHQTPDDEMLEAVKLYVDHVESLADPKDDRVWVRYEQRFDLTKYFPMLYGTADCVIYYKASKKLIVIDYKHGAGVPVEVENNSQLLYYGLGAMHALGLPVNSVELQIVQPRCFHPDGPIRSWTTNSLRVLEFVADLVDDAKATEDPDAPLVPGDHCRWCPAKHSCPALKEKSLALAAQSFTSLTSYDPEKLSQTLSMLPVMESWIKGVREFSYREAEAGRCPPGWKLVPKRAMRKWKEDINLDSLARNLGVKPPEIFETKLRSPAAVEKLLSKEAVKVLDQFVVKESSGNTLAPVDDKREPALSRAVTDFGSLI